MTMQRRARSFAAGLVFVFATATSGLLIGAGSASAAQPLVIGNCATTVQGAPGTPLQLSPSVLIAPVTNILKAIPLLGPTLAAPIDNAVHGMANIPLGTIPGANSTISGSSIAGAAIPMLRDAIDQIPLIGPVLSQIVSGVQSALVAGCGITVQVVNVVSAPVQDGTGAVAAASGQVQTALGLPGAPGAPPAQSGGGAGSPGTGGASQGTGSQTSNPGNTPSGGMPGSDSTVLGGAPSPGWGMYDQSWNFGRSPFADYSSIPFAKAGLFSVAPGVRYGGQTPGYTPQFGILGTDDQGDGVHAAGHAEALGPDSGGNKVALPVLLAVLALSGVTAALVRTWVLRRTPALV
jgi:hypothetical protein